MRVGYVSYNVGAPTSLASLLVTVELLPAPAEMVTEVEAVRSSRELPVMSLLVLSKSNQAVRSSGVMACSPVGSIHQSTATSANWTWLPIGTATERPGRRGAGGGGNLTGAGIIMSIKDGRGVCTAGETVVDPILSVSRRWYEEPAMGMWSSDARRGGDVGTSLVT